MKQILPVSRLLGSIQRSALSNSMTLSTASVVNKIKDGVPSKRGQDSNDKRSKSFKFGSVIGDGSTIGGEE